MYVFTGATGNTGNPIAISLLKAGKNVRVTSRSEDKLKEFAELGAETFVGELTDSEFLKRTFSGATTVYAMIPPNFRTGDYRGYQNKVTEAMAEAIEATGVKNVVTLSSVGAHLPEKGGVVQGLYDMEQRFNRISGLNVLHLRPTYFMENTLAQIETIKKLGVMGSLVKGDLRFPMVATMDIAEVATKRLLALDFFGPGNVQYILGSQDISYKEVASAIGNAIGKPDLNYVEFPFEDARLAMITGWGVTESVADAMTEFMYSMNKGLIFSEMTRDAISTTGTSINDFSNVFAQVYKNS
jgi:uncharacterized protein YbjT (DUF2867 family)